ncbi:DUF92 domain-containing protein [Edaphobacter bradus]|uniref:DUF92 domain-containing protein n=1 Tax=Edaphobacter bradus TaxID=2259016 RepID=UPI0021E08EB5|nr:DUF92 domain-containing protein [Edaphobacter bradus]
MEVWNKAIPRARDGRQSAALTWVVGLLLALAAAAPPIAALKLGLPLWSLSGPLLLSSLFAALVWGLRAATPGGTAMGWAVCFLLAQSSEVWTRFSSLPVLRPAFPALIVLFVLTSAATRFGRARKEARGVAEARSGRKASQIAANLGVAALFAAAGRYEGCIAALAEATADTVSSEIGQAVGGRALLITTLKPVPAGTDGGVSMWGTVAGVVAAGAIVAIGAMHHALWPNKAAVMGAACAGLLFDSLLGATVERRGWMGNDLVNFASTLFAALLAQALTR